MRTVAGVAEDWEDDFKPYASPLENWAWSVRKVEDLQAFAKWIAQEWLAVEENMSKVCSYVGNVEAPGW